MKKFLIMGLLVSLMFCTVRANEITEDYLDMAGSFTADGNYKDAIVYLDKILAIEPGNKSVLGLRNGLVRVIQGDKVYSIIAKNPVIKQAVNAKIAGNKQLELSSLSLGNDYRTNYFLGDFYRKNKDYTQAINYYIKSVNLKPDFTLCYMQIALCHYENGNYKQAVTYINQYLKNNGQDDFAYALRAEANAKLGDSAAVTDILTAIALENSIEYKFLEGKILYSLGRYFQAKQKLEALTTDIQTAELYKYMGLCDSELGNYSDALINLDKSIILFDEDKGVVSKYNEIRARIEN